MRFLREAPIFENRYDAGRQLAEKLGEYKGQPVVILAIPNGGLPVALQVALALGVDLDVVISRKIPIPLSPIVTTVRTMMLRWAVARVRKGRFVRQSTPVRHTATMHQATKRKIRGRGLGDAVATI